MDKQFFSISQRLNVASLHAPQALDSLAVILSAPGFLPAINPFRFGQ
jgi:hypothetical protein